MKPLSFDPLFILIVLLGLVQSIALTQTHASSHSVIGTGLPRTGGFVITSYHPDITSYPPACTVDGIVCPAEGADEHTPARPTEHTISTHQLSDTNSFQSLTPH